MIGFRYLLDIRRLLRFHCSTLRLRFPEVFLDTLLGDDLVKKVLAVHLITPQSASLGRL